MKVRIFEWRDTINKPDLGRYLKDRHGKGRLGDRIRQLLRRGAQLSQEPTPGNLQYYVGLYGEQVTLNASGDLAEYFTVGQNRGFKFTVGGLPTGFPALAIQPRDIKPSNTAISVIGEGLAGWYLAMKGMIPLRRPIGEGPDIIFVNRQGTLYALVQVKATQEPDVKAQIRLSAIPLLQYTLNVITMSSVDSYFCNIIGVIIEPGNDFDLLSLRIDIL